MDGLEDKSAAELLAWALGRYGDRFAVATSFQKEGMAIVDMAWRIRPDVRVFTLDTGRLPEETHAAIEAVRQRYGIRVEVVLPDPAEVEAMVGEHGPNLFRSDPALRAMCCEVRKVRPLERKLRTLDAWAAGLRREQSASRSQAPKVEAGGGAVKLCPLADWTAAQVDEYLRAHDVPLHPLYARGYKSIGCAPCTRATREGEDERAGRWWWERGTEKECGIHFTNDGRAVRAASPKGA
jgi:phosphoadenosine phosphosulfate reductase